MMMTRANVLPLLFAGVFASCARQGYTEAALSPDAEVITQDEVISSRGNSAYDVIKKIHANFLSNRGRTSFADTTVSMPMVFVDDQLFGPISALAGIPAAEIAEIRFYSAWEAVIKYGTGLPGGAISITTRLKN